MPPVELLASARSSRMRLGVGAAIVLLIGGLGIAVLATALTAGGSSQTVVSGPTPSSTGVSPTGAAIFVHILGEVNHPGLYRFRDGDRAIDAVAAAGGYSALADKRQVNLARFLVDGEQIYVPAMGEISLPNSASGQGGASGAAGTKINLNTADAATLETLPRVGPAMAKRIIEWRTTNGRFSAVEDLMSVSGIGEKTFSELKDLVTL